MTNEIKELYNFYLLDNKLIYISDEFIGFDPLISKGMIHKRKETGAGTNIILDNFKMDGSLFDAILIDYINWGPVRGYVRTEILKDGHTIINMEHGGMGHGSNYWKGDDFLVAYDNAYLVKRGYAMQDKSTHEIYNDLSSDNSYFFWFKNIVIPTKSKSWPIDGSALVWNKKYTLAEIEPFRQVKWEAQVNFNNHDFTIQKTAIPYCDWIDLGKTSKFKRNDGKEYSLLLDRIEFIK